MTRDEKDQYERYLNQSEAEIRRKYFNPEEHIKHIKEVKERRNIPEDHDGDTDPLNSGYSGPD